MKDGVRISSLSSAIRKLTWQDAYMKDIRRFGSFLCCPVPSLSLINMVVDSARVDCLLVLPKTDD